MSSERSVKLNVLGVVQGVGYRPFVARLGRELKLAGTVRNLGGWVEIFVRGDGPRVEEFIRRLRSDAPGWGELPEIQSEEIAPELVPEGIFSIIPSGQERDRVPVLPPDLSTCPKCEAELKDPRDRRYRYPFISCTECGPRWTIMERLPYDRETTVMEDFPLCPACAAEYGDIATRRCHAQTIACHDCGPVLFLRTKQGQWETDGAFDEAARLLRAGGVVAVRDIGGFHLACDPNNSQALTRLRRLKGREAKPFAVMFPDVSSVEAYCHLSEPERTLLCSIPRPIVLLRKRRDFAPETCGVSREIGCMLPCAPLQMLLMDACGPLVMTSGNRSGEPILTENETMLELLKSDDLDGVLYHARRICTPMDDSVARVAEGRSQMVRRARGYVPMPLTLPVTAEKTIFAAGGDLKACFCLMKGDRAYLSQHFGDMEDPGVAETYRRAVRRQGELLRLAPERGICDLHPGYHSRAFARSLDVPLQEVQHHHAHIASVMAEHGLAGPVLGLAFDGTGYGTDGAVWGGELLLCEGPDMTRLGHLDYVPLCGGDKAAKDAAFALASYRCHAGLPAESPEAQTVRAAIAAGINTTPTSSMGRLFDAVSALLGLGTYNNYEGACAVALENAAAEALERGEDPAPAKFPVMERDGMLLADTGALIRSLTEALEAGESPGTLALSFHRGVIAMGTELMLRARTRTGVSAAALSGGVFMNRILLSGLSQALREAGFTVYRNERVPMNDGGVALGQVYLAAMKED
ncbi:MAG: carbamoyltransferase HypF [Oscillospiraceae bacterium]|nr:carbamoyltransferase HypF [Oscillospiraceae bacterium]